MYNLRLAVKNLDNEVVEVIEREEILLSTALGMMTTAAMKHGPVGVVLDVNLSWVDKETEELRNLFLKLSRNEISVDATIDFLKDMFEFTPKGKNSG